MDASLNSNAQEKVNILLVDDQPAKLLSYEAILGELGETLITATTAREALTWLLKADIGLILIDVCMPELDGFELASMIREHPRFQKTPLIFVSAVQLTDLDRLRGYEAGAVDYVPVPVVPEVLRAKVRVFAELHRKTRQLERLNAELENRVAERTSELEASASRLKESEQQLININERLENLVESRTRERETALAQLFEAQKIDTIGQLTGGVAHDFNNLLMAILGSLELLRKRLPDEPRMLRLLDNAVQGAERGAALTQRLLAFARRQELKPQSVQAPRLIRGMRDLLDRALGPGIEMKVDISDDLRPIEADANQLELAILNLVVNARDAMPSGGSVTIVGREETHQEATEKGAQLTPGDYVCIEVIDTGMGMDESTLARAREPFFTTKGPGKGTGLGLSMVHGLAAQSGGALIVTSKIDVGTTVTLYLPRAAYDCEEVDELPVAKAQGPHAADAHATVLLVDDDALVRTGTAAMIEDLGFVVIECESAVEALQAIEARGGDIDVVITDHAMPGMSGLELIRVLKSNYPGMPVILASGFAEIPGGDAAALAPRLAKPFRQTEISCAIMEAIRDGRRSPRNATAELAEQR
jgi:signal transduction histidine kinase/ActR/RegA family two-component response regulator